MKTLLLGSALLLAASLMAQQQPHPPHQPPAQQPPSADQPTEAMPPDTKAPASPELPNSEVEQKIQHTMADMPELSSSNVKVSVTDDAISLTGTVDSQQQHDLALRVAQSYAGDRSIDDKVQIRGHA